MTAPAGLTPTRRGAGLVAVVLGIIVVLAFLARPGSSRYAIGSKEDDGLLGLAEILREVGADVDESVFSSDLSTADVVVITNASTMGPDQVDELFERRPDASRVVFLGVPSQLGRTEYVDEPQAGCSIPELQGLEAPTESGNWYGVEPVRPSGSGWRLCFGETAGLIAERDDDHGGTALVSSIDLATNLALGPNDLFEPLQPPEPWPDNGPVLVTTILSNSVNCDGPCRVRFVNGGLRGGVPDQADSGEGDLLALIPDRGAAVLVQLMVAGLIYTAFRMRRHGRVLVEPDPVEIEASELVAASARVTAAGRHHGRASVRLRNAACDELARLVGIHRSEGLDRLVNAVAAVSGRAEPDVRRLLEGAPVMSDDELASLDAALDDLRKEVRGDRRS